MSYTMATDFLKALGATVHEENMKVAVEVIAKYGSYRNAMIEAQSIQYKTKDQLLFALLGESGKDNAPEVKRIISVMHMMRRTILNDADARGEDFMKLMLLVNIKKTFNPTDAEMFVINELGGREFIAVINEKEPNALRQWVEKALTKYDRISNSTSVNQLEHRNQNLAIANLAGEVRV